MGGPGLVAAGAATPATSRWAWALLAAGLVGLGLAAGLDPPAAQAAAGQDWPPFVLVAGLLLVGVAADADGLFAAAGDLLARLAPHPAALFAGAMTLVAVVTAVLNLDTSVAFLAPVLAYTAARRGSTVALLGGCLLMSNAASLLLPGSNLTNLIVLGHLHESGGAFAARMAPAWAAAVAVTAAVVWVAGRRSPGGAVPAPARTRPRLGTGAAAVAVATVAVLALGDAAPVVAAVGALAAALAVARRRVAPRRVADALGAPVLAGLFGVAVALGAAGRAWDGPAQLLGHLDAWGTAGVAALASVAVNNLPAASVLAARVPPHPAALLVGLDVGPNLLVTGSLAWVLWLRSVRATGTAAPLAATVRLGLVAAPAAGAAALAVLAATGHR